MHSKVCTVTGGAAGDLFDLGTWVAELEIVADGTAVAVVSAPLMSPTDTPPIAPVATPIAAAGSASADGWENLGANGKVVFRRDPYGLKAYRYIPVWGITAGKITVSGQ